MKSFLLGVGGIIDAQARVWMSAPAEFCLLNLESRFTTGRTRDGTSPSLLSSPNSGSAARRAAPRPATEPSQSTTTGHQAPVRRSCTKYQRVPPMRRAIGRPLGFDVFTRTAPPEPFDQPEIGRRKSAPFPRHHRLRRDRGVGRAAAHGEIVETTDTPYGHRFAAAKHAVRRRKVLELRRAVNSAMAEIAPIS